MRWRVMAKTPELHSFGQSPRRWPFFTGLLGVIILGSSTWLYSRVMPTYNEQISRTNLLSTPGQMMYNPFGPNYTFERAVQISNCTNHGGIKTSSTLLPSNDISTSRKECPSYFYWIQQDLAPWKETGITKASVERAGQRAAFKAVIVDGNLYIDRINVCYGNRALFTVWGMLLLLNKYKGQVPDLEMMFNCEDRPRLPKSRTRPAPLFGYNSNNDHFDIPFPDWTFWGWSDLMIDNWDEEREKIVKSSGKVDWKLKVPKAYWSGNSRVKAPHRAELLLCNGGAKSEIRPKDWSKELPRGKENSKLEDQCNHRYMIYAEGVGWSVSLKYILACGSPTLAISPAFYDFFSRGLLPWVHFIPVRPSALRAPELCEVLDKQVEFCEANETKAVQIGKSGQSFVQQEIGMENVYDYMFHLLSEYAKLQKFRPSIPEYPFQITLDHVVCLAEPRESLALQQAMKVMPLGTAPCHISNTPADGFKEADWVAKM